MSSLGESNLGDDLGDSSWYADGSLQVSGATLRSAWQGCQGGQGICFTLIPRGNGIFQGREGFRWDESVLAVELAARTFFRLPGVRSWEGALAVDSVVRRFGSGGLSTLMTRHK